MCRLIAGHYLRDFSVWLRFADGTEGEVYLGEDLNGPVFEPLKEVSYFAKVKYDPELRTIGWPNGADWAPETLYEMLVEQRGGNSTRARD